MRHGFTLIELIVVVAVIAVLASIILVAVTGATVEAQRVRTQAFINDYKVGISKYLGSVHKYPFVADAQGDFNPDDCWRELSPLTPDLTAGIQPADARYRNRNMVDCLSLGEEQLAVLSDGQRHVVDIWKRPFCMQWDYFNKRPMLWSAGPDGRYDISDDPINGGHSSLFCNQADAQNNTPPAITAAIQQSRLVPDLSNE